MGAKSAAKRIALEVLGWTLVIGGIAALVLPGPGLLALFAGLAVLSQQYEWAERRLEPVKARAFQTAADGVRTWPRIIASVIGGLMVMAVGVLWFLQPPAPGWWPVRDSWWLFGGMWAGVTLILSGIIALALIVYSYRHFRGVDDAELAERATGA
ncbi:PGPGW domain-containing protein [Nocardioides sp.]|uniref:PGPGW domain-containing protein n=1 Tax=Nocardioides sp. TaxID=35761 RepID=UPI003D13C6BB